MQISQQLDSTHFVLVCSRGDMTNMSFPNNSDAAAGLFVVVTDLNQYNKESEGNLLSKVFVRRFRSVCVTLFALWPQHFPTR